MLLMLRIAAVTPTDVTGGHVRATKNRPLSRKRKAGLMFKLN